MVSAIRSTMVGKLRMMFCWRARIFEPMRMSGMKKPMAPNTARKGSPVKMNAPAPNMAASSSLRWSICSGVGLVGRPIIMCNSSSFTSRWKVLSRKRSSLSVNEPLGLRLEKAVEVPTSFLANLVRSLSSPSDGGANIRLAAV